MSKWVTIKIPLSQLRTVLTCAKTDVDRVKKLFANSTPPEWLPYAEKGIARMREAYNRHLLKTIKSNSKKRP